MKLNPLAQSLNQTLEGSVAYRLLSDLGKRMFFPRGVAAQSMEAKEKAHRFDATVGIANVERGKPIILEEIHRWVPELSPAEIVSYAPTPGDPELRKLWQQEILRKNPDVPPDRISLPMVTSGLTGALSQVADLFVNPHDHVLVSDFFWGNYRLLFEGRREARLVTYPLFTEEGSLDLEALERTIRDIPAKKAVLVLNFPNNPTGYTPTVDEARAMAGLLARCAEEKDLLVVCDDAYFGLFYEEGIYPHSLFNLLATAHPNLLAVKVDGPTKELYVWGFRIGFLTFGSPVLTAGQFDALNQKLAGSLRATVSNSNRLAQSLLKRALTSAHTPSELAKWADLLKARYRKTRQILSRMGDDVPLVPQPFNSGYFMCFKTRGIDAEALRQALLEKGIGTISLGRDVLRVTFASIPEEHLEELFSEIFETARSLA
ncbi:aminotransferase class I and II [Spirochaeta thermophila DSM 6578]|uniref:Aminotransferase class I and II n=1 Tax=Winmispira thermophila (strain ATCC 700085 / DSM 6578 / Z-1203) TaxID=869211 RepID=G0GCQ4_WINT7|nr:aminotransferase class I/II-fold pyridoxal phosphate-dependent enzyme [Spirochaeta thermophila]AEJ60473.1 aminotransferase class I and II [Spirochaeta thermophila DSM 6578]